jgi:hypothetical protein
MDNQEIVVFGLAVLAAIYLLWRLLKAKAKKAKKVGCGSDCGC